MKTATELKIEYLERKHKALFEIINERILIAHENYNRRVVINLKDLVEGGFVNIGFLELEDYYKLLGYRFICNLESEYSQVTDFQISW